MRNALGISSPTMTQSSAWLAELSTVPNVSWSNTSGSAKTIGKLIFCSSISSSEGVRNASSWWRGLRAVLTWPVFVGTNSVIFAAQRGIRTISVRPNKTMVLLRHQFKGFNRLLLKDKFKGILSLRIKDRANREDGRRGGFLQLLLVIICIYRRAIWMQRVKRSQRAKGMYRRWTIPGQTSLSQLRVSDVVSSLRYCSMLYSCSSWIFWFLF
jgi:hypothetical protein